VPEEPGTEFDVNAAGGVAEDVGSKGIEDGLKDHHDHQANDKNVKGGHAFVDQDLVHHHLEEQGGDQGEELQHEADQEHFAQEFSVLDEAGDEPGEVEFGQSTGQ